MTGANNATSTVDTFSNADPDAIYTVVARCLGVARDQLTPTTSIAELGVDSIDLLALAVELEEEFDVVIPDEALFRVLMIGDAVPCMAAAFELRRIGRQANGE